MEHDISEGSSTEIQPSAGGGAASAAQKAAIRRRRDVRRTPLSVVLLVCGIVVLGLGILALCLGRYQVDVVETVRILLSTFTQQDITWTANDYNVIMNVRLPRVIAAILIGASLALSGAAYQGVFQNPLVSPDILGVSYGACVGAAVSILLYLNTWQTQLFAFVGGLLTVFITVSIPKLMHRRSNIVMVLSGVIVGGFMSSVIGLLKYVADPDTQLAEITYWQLGSIAKVTYDTLSYTAPVMIVAGIVHIAMRWRINLLSLGEGEARSLGVNLKVERAVVILASTLLTACAVSLSGTIGWIGLIIPHVTRRIVGDDNRRLIPTTALVAAGFLLIVDTVARCATGFEIPLGILTGLIGAPIFGYILIKQKDVD